LKNEIIINKCLQTLTLLSGHFTHEGPDNDYSSLVVCIQEILVLNFSPDTTMIIAVSVVGFSFPSGKS
jgi:hypothetical protein